jgi:hypothetical protein
VLIDAIKDRPKGQAKIESCVKWNNAVHQISPRHLTIFSTLSFQPGQPEVKPGHAVDAMLDLPEQRPPSINAEENQWEVERRVSKR